jgi:acetoin utilization deacetylase AcuC-like enzyme
MGWPSSRRYNPAMLPFKLVYSDRYDLNLGHHVFPSEKYRLIHDRLLSEGFADSDDFVEPRPASDEQILLVHKPEWVQKLKTGTLNYFDVMKLEIPYSKEMVEAFWLSTGGTILASRNALRDRIGFNIGGGYHHAFPGHGEGFCAIHDVAVAIRVLQKEGPIARAMVVDCDVHHGNGTAGIFTGDNSVVTLSIHQFENYPTEKPPSTIGINLADGVGDEEYLRELRGAMAPALADFRPDLMAYLAGADPYREDQLGGLLLTMDGLRTRDRLVMETALARGIPMVVLLAGGYARNTNDTVTIHCNTAKAAKDVLEAGH